MNPKGESAQSPEYDLAVEACSAIGVLAGNIRGVTETLNAGAKQAEGVYRACAMMRSALERYKRQKYKSSGAAVQRAGVASAK